MECFRCVCHEILRRFFEYWYPMVDLLLELKLWYATLVLGRQWISEEICGSIQFYAFLCALNFVVAVCTLFLSLAWHYAYQCIVTKINGTIMWGPGLGDILLVIIVNYTGDSAIFPNRICPRLFIHIGLKFPYDREYFLVEMYILLSLVVLEACGRRVKVGNKWNNRL